MNSITGEVRCVLGSWVSFPRCMLGLEATERLKADLRVRPKGKDYETNEEYLPINAYFDCPASSVTFVPRFYGVNTLLPQLAKNAPFQAPQPIFSDMRSKGVSWDKSVPMALSKPLDETKRNQETAVRLCMAELLENASGTATLCLPPGDGKTFTALHIASLLGVRTLVVVHTAELMTQWIEVISREFPGAVLGKIKGSKVAIPAKGCHFVVAMLKSLTMDTPRKTKGEPATPVGPPAVSADASLTGELLSYGGPGDEESASGSKKRKLDSREVSFSDKNWACRYGTEMFEQFGFAILDEAHHMCALTYSRILSLVKTRYVLALTGTPDKKSGMNVLTELFLGPPTFSPKRIYANAVYVYKLVVPEYTVVAHRGGNRGTELVPATEKLIRYGPHKDKTDRVTMLSDMSQSASRNAVLADALVKLLCESPRHVLALSCRVEHLEVLKKMVDERMDAAYPPNGGVAKTVMAASGGKSIIPAAGVFTGKTKPKHREEMKRHKLILSTPNMFAEAIDVPTLSVVFYLTPEPTVAQSCARAMRTKEGGVNTLILYAFDPSLEYWNRVWYQCQSHFVKEKYVITSRPISDYHPAEKLPDPPPKKDPVDVDDPSDAGKKPQYSRRKTAKNVAASSNTPSQKCPVVM